MEVEEDTKILIKKIIKQGERKIVTIPKSSSLKAGDYVCINKVVIKRSV